MVRASWRGLGVLASTLLCVAALGAYNGLGHADRLLADWFMLLGERPAHDEIVIVGIDDHSLARIGRWPWRRNVHAQLLERLRQSGARVVGLDVILSEPDLRYPDDDAALTQAVAASGNVVLPMRMENLGAGGPGAVLPIPALAAAARAVGHIHIELDRDGVARSVFLREGFNGFWWPHFARAMARVGRDGVPEGLGERHPDVAAGRPTPLGLWSRDEGIPIPYAGPPGHFRYLSYAHVLNGEIPAEALRDRYVLVGALAGGMGDAYPTPVASRDGLMPGVEIVANTLAALLDGATLRAASRWENALFSVAPIVLAMLALRRLRGRHALGILALLSVATLLVAYLAQRYALIQFSPAAALGCLLLAYPVWNWRRLEAATRYLAEEFRRMEADGAVHLEGADTGSPRDALGQRIDSLTRASAQLRALQRFTRQSMDGLADPVLVSDETGCVRMANRVANHYFARGAADVLGEGIGDVLARRVQLPPDTPLYARGAVGGSFNLAAEDIDGRACIVKGTPRAGGRGGFGGWILTVVDVSALEEAQRQREEALRFMTHDMRSPQASIVSLVDLRRAGLLDEEQALGRIERHALRTLSMADGFANLAYARSADYELQQIDLTSVLLDAADQLWDRAQARRARVQVEVPEEECLIDGDATLITRALANLIDNAIKYGPEGGVVVCRLLREEARITLAVIDQGLGIAEADLPHIFNLFGRASAAAETTDGFGLGLAFAHAVLSRHAATIEVRSVAGAGTTFTLGFPVSALSPPGAGG
ncbi:MAG: CHASE2 domain-containing protein [Candidatus Dactylopiibacterium sp.]|nr:CHASE2 domain-containing protein [Candidatus Dactylopiibacterium sp.]